MATKNVYHTQFSIISMGILYKSDGFHGIAEMLIKVRPQQACIPQQCLRRQYMYVKVVISTCASWAISNGISASGKYTYC